MISLPKLLSLVLLSCSMLHSTVLADVDHDKEIAVMKREIAWGRNEMLKYKSLRGSWPVREGNGLCE